MNGLSGYSLLAPDNLVVVPSAEIGYNHEILAVRQRDSVPVMFSFDETTCHYLVSLIFISETDLVHSCKIVNS